MMQLQSEVTRWVASMFPDASAATNIQKMQSELEKLLKTPWSEDEMADVLIVLSAYASRFGVDLENAVRRKMEINRQRNWHREADGTYQHDGTDKAAD
jgi:NTP pyrophosphatase (non-canonical NTP hydrolase)